MKILVVGDGHSEIHERAVAESFRKLGHKVEVFYWYSYFQADNSAKSYWFRGQNKFIWGPQLYKLNRDLIQMVCRFIPDLIFIYRGTHITPSTIINIKKKISGCKIFGYNNDDPFASGHPPWLWRHFLRAVPEYDLMLAYRHHNLEQYRKIGARQVELLRSWSVPWINHPLDMTKEDMMRYGCDIVFVGHYEPDCRVALLESVISRGWHLRLYGPGYDWDPVISRSLYLAGQIPVRLVWGDDYNRALCGARIALCFLSKLNRDTYTRRCFEIPATRTLMISEYTEDLASLFREGEEADFFRTPEEMMAKIELYLNDEPRRKAVAEAGFRRVHADGHDVVSRMRQVLAWIADMQEDKP
jgi:hypothetical protein